MRTNTTRPQGGGPCSAKMHIPNCWLTLNCLVREPTKASPPKSDITQFWAHDMTLRIEAKHDLAPNEIGAIEDRLYNYNSDITGRHDGRGLGFVIRDQAGQIIGLGLLNLNRCGLMKYIEGACARTVECFYLGGLQSRCSSDLGS